MQQQDTSIPAIVDMYKRRETRVPEIQRHYNWRTTRDFAIASVPAFCVAPLSATTSQQVMHTLRLFASRQFEIPATTAWYVSDLGEYRGKQQLYTRQSPQRILKLAYGEFEERVGEIKAPRGSKREQVLMGIARLGERATPEFSIRELEQACPGVSRDMVRRVLRDEQAAGRLECRKGTGCHVAQEEVMTP